MEEPRPPERGAEQLIAFPPHRRSHLRSGTYRNLVRLVSLCCGDSPLANAPPIIPLRLTQDNGSNQGGLGGNEIKEPGVSTVPDNREPANMPAEKGEVVDGGGEGAILEDREPSNTQMVIDQIEQVMGIEESQGFSDQNGLMINGSGEGPESQDGEIEDNGSNQGKPGGNEIKEPGDLAVPDNREPANMPAEIGEVVDGGGEGAVLEDREPSNTQMVIDQIDQMMGIEESQGFSNQNGLMINGSGEGPGCQDGEIGREQMLMNELEIIMKGNEDCDNSDSCLAASLDQDHCNNCLGVMVNDQEESIDPPLLVEESGRAGQQQVDMEVASQKIIEAFGYDSDETCTAEVSKSSQKVEDQSSLLATNAVHEKIAIQQKEMDLDNSVCSTDTRLSPGQMVEDGELEEGEIFGDIQLPDQSLDILLGNAVELEKMADEELVSGGAVDDKHLLWNEESTAKDKDSVFSSFTDIGQITDRVTAVELEGNGGDQILSELGRTCGKEGSGEILKQSQSKSQVTKSENKEDIGICAKKKRGPISAEKKEKKKQKKRKKRAEKNRQLGVKKLKLETVLNKKGVSDCKHYMMGRCHQGEKCKFSHDKQPLTKSQPCCHFARHACMKGDECPYDHQLSKYPCNNYVSKGFCSRGDDCLFSHKMSTAGDDASLSNARELQQKPSLQGDSDMRLNMSRNVDASSCSAEVLFQRSKKRIVAETPTKTPDPVLKGVKSLLVSNASVAESSKLNQGSSCQMMIESGRVGIQSNQITSGVCSFFPSKPSLADTSKFSEGSSSLKMNKVVRLGTQANQSKPVTNQNVDDCPKRKTEVVPKGINVLSFGKSSSEDSTSKVSLALKQGDAYKQNPIGSEGDRGKLGNQTIQNTSSTDQKKTRPTVPLGINFLGKLGHLRSNEASTPSRSDIFSHGFIQKINYSSDKQQKLSAMSYKLPDYLQTSGQSPDCLSEKGPNAVQNALISTIGAVRQTDNVMSRSIHESQHIPAKQVNSNSIPCKMPAYMPTVSQSSEKMSQNPNSAQKALVSTLSIAAKFESGMKKNKSAVSIGVINETRDSKNQ